MRKMICVPMIALCLLLTGCGGTQEEQDLRAPYRAMEGCLAEAVVRCDREGYEWEATLSCDYSPEGESRVEVVAPETLLGVAATLRQEDWQLEYEELCLDAGPLSAEQISPMTCLPRLISALREGWLLEQNEEQWRDVPCLRLSMDQTGEQGGKILSTLWLRLEDGTPLRGEIAVDGEIILTAEFTAFTFYDTISQ